MTIVAHSPNGNGHRSYLDRLRSAGPLVPLLTFEGFSTINMERHLNWPHKEGHSTNWSIGDWGVAVAEEAGEVCGAIKRYNRVVSGQIIKGKDNEPLTPEDALLMLKKEIGDLATYMDLLAQEKVGCGLEECIRLAFNGVSEREGMNYRI